MRIGFMISSEWVLVRGHGVVAQARQQAEALESIGHTVDLLNPWRWQDINDLDVLHFFADCALYPALKDEYPIQRRTLVAYSPIIDSNQSFTAYRLAADLGSYSSKLMTVAGIGRSQAQHSDVVICRSQHEQRRVRESLRVPEAKLEVVLNGCSEPRKLEISADSTINSLELPKDYVLHISAFTQERKNVLRLSQAAAELGFPLVIAGHAKNGPVLDELKQRIRQGQRIILLGFVDEATKAALYSRCRVFCLPSHHEGTGLVAVEAASYGANLVITRNGGPPDYFLDMAEYVDPFDLADIRRGLAVAWDRPKNDRLKNHLMGNLTWKHSARALADVYSKHRESLLSTSAHD
jgi:glycosyltransferase involved in cell wall biosynthesis